MNCDCVLVNPNCGNSDSDSRPESESELFTGDTSKDNHSPEGLGYNFSINENTHGSSHLIQQTSSYNTETHSESRDESYLTLNLSNIRV